MSKSDHLVEALIKHIYNRGEREILERLIGHHISKIFGFGDKLGFHMYWFCVAAIVNYHKMGNLFIFF